MVIQKKKFLLFENVNFENNIGNFSFGLRNINVGTSNGIAPSVFSDILDNAVLNFEEYRVSRIIVRAQPGQGFTNDDRIKTSIFSRVDVNDQPTAATPAALNSLISAESTVNRTFTERSNVKLADFAPICFAAGSTSRAILYPEDQWYDLTQRSNQLWRGVTVAPVIPETLSPGEKALTVWIEVHIDFRSRRNATTTFTASLLTPQRQNAIKLEEIEESQEGDLELREETSHGFVPLGEDIASE
jgi:hypothetical protein